MQNTCTPTLIPAYCAFSPSLLQFQHEFTVQHFFFNAHTQRHSYIHAHTSTCLQTLLFNAPSPPPSQDTVIHTHTQPACKHSELPQQLILTTWPRLLCSAHPLTSNITGALTVTQSLRNSTANTISRLQQMFSGWDKALESLTVFAFCTAFSALM